MKKDNYSFRACQIFALLGTHSDDRSYQIHLDHELSYKVAKTFAEDSGIEDIVKLAEAWGSGTRAEMATNAHPSVNGSYVELPIFDIAHRPENEDEVLFECKAYLAVCVGDNHSKLFVRMSTASSSYPSVQARSFAHDFAKKLITEVITPRYRELSRGIIMDADDNDWKDIEVSELYYVPLEAVSSDDSEIRNAFRGLATHSYKKLVDAFRENEGFQNIVKEQIVSKFDDSVAWDNVSLAPAENDEAGLVKLKEAFEGLEWVFVDNIGGNDGLFLIQRDEEELSTPGDRQPAIKYRGIFVDSDSSSEFDLNETTDNYLNAVVG